MNIIIVRPIISVLITFVYLINSDPRRSSDILDWIGYDYLRDAYQGQVESCAIPIRSSPQKTPYDN